MAETINPAVNAFVQSVQREIVFGQIVIRREAPGFEIRHAADASRPAAELALLAPGQVLDLAQHSATGQFRPLKSAPSLKSGWRLALKSEAELELALNHIYPGALADWHAIRTPPPPVTNYREFTNRQSGMYRITQKLNDAQAANAIRATCHRDFCLKQRLWTVEGLASDTREEKSLIPCLEPCAVLLEFARRAMRIEQEEPAVVELRESDVAALTAAVERALAHPDPDVREGAFDDEGNPRRLRYVLEKMKGVVFRRAGEARGGHEN